jgi:C4-dicarboxylate-specific signal transduction histidine kinase
MELENSDTLKFILDSIKVSVLVENIERKVVFVNSEYCNEFHAGTTPQDWIGKVRAELLLDKTKIFSELQLMYTQMDVLVAKQEAELNHVISAIDGRTFNRTYQPIFSNGKIQGHLWIYKNITAQTLLEKDNQLLKLKMISAAKMSAVGEMAGSIAHEINNPLTAITSQLSKIAWLYKNNQLTDVNMTEEAKKVMAMVLRIKKIINGIRSFVRGGEAERLQTEVSAIVDDSLSLCQEKFKAHGVDVFLEIEDNLPMITCNPVQISQVFINLLNNAYDAMEPIRDKWVRINISKLERFLQFRVSNAGPGVPEGIRERIFDAFFTTKPGEKGTGLGLSVSKEIIVSHGGQILLSENLDFAEFVFTLPIILETE